MVVPQNNYSIYGIIDVYMSGMAGTQNLVGFNQVETYLRFNNQPK